MASTMYRVLVVDVHLTQILPFMPTEHSYLNFEPRLANNRLSGCRMLKEEQGIKIRFQLIDCNVLMVTHIRATCVGTVNRKPPVGRMPIPSRLPLLVTQTNSDSTSLPATNS